MDGHCSESYEEGQKSDKDITLSFVKDQIEVCTKSCSCEDLLLHDECLEVDKPPLKKLKSEKIQEVEKVPIRCFDILHGEDNYDHVQSGLVYVTSSFPGTSLSQDAYEECIQGCECIESVCCDSCGCVMQYGCPYNNGKLKELFYKKPVFECNDMCSCGFKCPSRVVQRGPVFGLSIVSLPNKGYGVITTHFIPKGSFVCEYAGEYISVQEARRRFSRQTDKDSNYILILKEHLGETASEPIITIIDPTIVGNIGRYLNHSCDPNLMVVPVRINFMLPLAALFAVHDILPGEELCYDYSCTTLSGVEGLLNSHHFEENTSPLNLASCSKHEVSDEKESNNVSSGIHDFISGGCEVLDACSSNKGAALEKVLLSGSRKACCCMSINCRKYLPADRDIL